MEINNELRRVKEKLRILETTPNIGWVIADAIAEAFPNGSSKYAEYAINKLKKDYKKYIKENTPKDLSQLNIFEDDNRKP